LSAGALAQADARSFGWRASLGAVSEGRRAGARRAKAGRLLARYGSASRLSR
jgi:hypothetical protein